MKIETADLNDLDNAMKVYTKVTDKMLANSISQWQYDYPDRGTLTADIVSGNLFVIKDDSRVIATMVLDDKQDEQYATVHWRYRNKHVLVIHRLAVHPDFQGRGLSKKLCLFAEEYGKSNGYLSIRLDAYSGNPISSSLYLKLGYHRANGFCYFRQMPKLFYCYEKSLM